MRCRLVVITFTVAIGLPVVGAAQPTPSRGLAGVSVGSYSVSADAVDGTLAAAGVSGSVAINPFLDLEAEILRPSGSVQRQYTGVLFSFAEQGASREEIERQGVVVQTTHERTLSSVLSFGAAFHPRRTTSRFQPRVFVGVTTHFVKDQTLLEPLRWPATVTLERVWQSIVPVEQHRRALGSLTFGAGVSIDIARRVVLMPDLRYDYGSIGDEINNTWRAGTKVLWRF